MGANKLEGHGRKQAALTTTHWIKRVLSKGFATGTLTQAPRVAPRVDLGAYMNTPYSHSHVSLCLTTPRDIRHHTDLISSPTSSMSTSSSLELRLCASSNQSNI
jgi:hypothetical protein